MRRIVILLILTDLLVPVVNYHMDDDKDNQLHFRDLKKPIRGSIPISGGEVMVFLF